MKKRISISVINDLVTDQRLQRMAGTLIQEGFIVKIIGRQFRNSLSIRDVAYNTHRFRMLFSTGPLFYACFNIRLFFSLLFARKIDLLIAVDLDTLLANYLVGRLRSVPLIYDCHEYFTEVPELLDRKGKKEVWEKLESKLVPNLQFAVTVSDSIARAYKEKYGVDFVTIRNVPLAKKKERRTAGELPTQSKYNLIYQGALNVGRGIELMIEAMIELDDMKLIIVGEGDISEDLRSMVQKMGLSDRVIFKGIIKPLELHRLTSQCSLGLSLEEGLGLSYRYSLPNKIFDYIQARIPVLCSDLPEMASLVKAYEIGEVLLNRDSLALSKELRRILEDDKQLAKWQLKLEKAAGELCWEKEAATLVHLVYKALEK